MDLAWSNNQKTGIAVAEGGEEGAEIKEVLLLKSDEEIRDFIKDRTEGKPVFISIDAPLIVPNEKGRRIAEDLIQKIFQSYKAVAYPANRSKLLRFYGVIRGEKLSALLEDLDIKQDPFIKRFERARKFFEVYPHPAIVSIFNLKEIIKYKYRPGRSQEFIKKELKRYMKLLKSLERAKPPFKVPPCITQKDLGSLKGKSLKEFEDLLDAVMCSYIAFFCWSNPERCRVLGDLKEGYILTPVPYNFNSK